jgi:hypothetical protein
MSRGTRDRFSLPHLFQGWLEPLVHDAGHSLGLPGQEVARGETA